MFRIISYVIMICIIGGVWYFMYKDDNGPKDEGNVEEIHEVEIDVEQN